MGLLVEFPWLGIQEMLTYILCNSYLVRMSVRYRCYKLSLNCSRTLIVCVCIVQLIEALKQISNLYATTEFWRKFLIHCNILIECMYSRKLEALLEHFFVRVCTPRQFSCLAIWCTHRYNRNIYSPSSIPFL